MNCNLCPRNCLVDRKLVKGFCGVTDKIYAARAALHMWEEPCISGENGSGTIFFSGCTLKCIFCQNRDIARATIGKEISIDRLAEIFIELQEKKANNINLVTPSHYVPQIIEALKISRNNGLKLPVVYNTGSYEKVDTLRLLEGDVDTYLPDMKYFNSELSKQLSMAEDYFVVASKAIDEMVRQKPKPCFYGKDDYEVKNGLIEEGIIKSGVIVRHLVLPGCIEDSKKIIKYLYEKYGDSIYISIMNQYTPLEHMKNHEFLGRKLTNAEYDEVVDYAIELGVNNGFIQEGETATESFIPTFDYEGIL